MNTLIRNLVLLLTSYGSIKLINADFTGTKMKNFCYFTNWSNKMANPDARFDIRDINATLCSHLIYAFANIDYVNMKLEASQNDDDNGQVGNNKKGRYFDFNKLKINHPQLVTLLSVGGAAGGGFQQVVASKETMVTFARNVGIYLRDRDFDGIDIDWEWPDDTYRNKFTSLLKIFRDEFDQESAESNKKRLLISIAVAVGEETISKSYNIPEISQYVDYIQVMAYDFHGTWSRVTSFSSPLRSRGSNIRFNQQLSQTWAIDRWISGGAPREKLIMGLTGVALTFTLDNITDAGVGASASVGQTGPYLGRPGHATYYKVCDMIRNDGAVHRYDDEQEMAYAVSVLDDQWVGYPNPDSMREKVRFAYSRQLAGTMFWTLEMDDFLGLYCNDGEYPLLTSIYNSIQEFAPSSARPSVTKTTQTTHSTTPIDFRLHHKTNKNGINFFAEKPSGNGATCVTSYNSGIVIVSLLFAILSSML